MTSSDSMRKFNFRNYFACVNALGQNMHATSAMLTRTFFARKIKANKFITQQISMKCYEVTL